jgi:hypothetical protein
VQQQQALFTSIHRIKHSLTNSKSTPKNLCGRKSKNGEKNLLTAEESSAAAVKQQSALRNSWLNYIHHFNASASYSPCEKKDTPIQQTAISTSG